MSDQRILVARIKNLIPNDPDILDLDVDSLVVLAKHVAAWKNSTYTRGELIGARRQAAKEYVASRFLFEGQRRSGERIIVVAP